MIDDLFIIIGTKYVSIDAPLERIIHFVS